MSVPTGQADGWFFQKPSLTGHTLTGIIVVVVVEEVVVVVLVVVARVVLVVVLVGRVVVVDDEVVVVVGRVVVVVVGLELRSADSCATNASCAPPGPPWAAPAVPGRTGDSVKPAM